MSGLIEKDIRLLLQRKSILIMYVFIACFMSFYTDSTFIVSYFCMIGTMLAISTISYDEFDNGYPFLMTLPISRATYAVEKYALTAACCLLCWVGSVGLQAAIMGLRKIPFDLSEMLSLYILFFLAFLIVASVMLPVELKFGVEKARIFMFVIFGIVMILTVTAGKLMTFAKEKLSVNFDGIIETLNTLPKAAVVLMFLAAAAVCLAISLTVSIGIMKKKEY